MTRQQVLDLYFMENRAKLIDLAAFLDRVDRAEGEADFRLGAFQQAMRCLGTETADRAKNRRRHHRRSGLQQVRAPDSTRGD